MGAAPILFELLDLLISEAVGLEVAPRTQTTLIAKSQITNYPNCALRRVFIEAAIRHAKNFACSDAVGLVTRIVRGIESAIGVKFPLLVRKPSEVPRFDAGEVAAKELVSGRRRDHAAREITNNPQR